MCLPAHEMSKIQINEFYIPFGGIFEILMGDFSHTVWHHYKYTVPKRDANGECSYGYRCWHISG